MELQTSNAGNGITIGDGRIIIRLDASALVKTNCMLAAKRILLDGWRTELPYNDTLYGNAFHRFVSLMYESKGDFSVAVDGALTLYSKPKQIRHNKKHLTEEHLTKTCIDYWQYFQSKDTADVLIRNGKPMVEVNFSLKYYEDDKVVVLLEGTTDKYVKFKNGIFAIGDYKTHSLWSLNKSESGKVSAMKAFFRGFESSPQLRFYTMVTKLLGKIEPEGPFGELVQFPIGCFIDGIFLSSTDKTEFHRSEVFIIGEKDLADFEEGLALKVAQLVRLAKTENYNMMDGMLTGVCNSWKFPCQFLDVCLARDERVKGFVLKNNFVQKPYEPLEFSK